MIRKRMLSKRLLVAILVIATAFTMMPLIGGSAYAANGDNELTLELESDGTTFVEGDPVYIKASGDPNSETGAWVGMYKEGETPGEGANPNSLRWYYVGKHEGEVINIVDPVWWDVRQEQIKQGNYKIILFGDGNYNNIITEIHITVIPDPNKEPAEPADESTLKLVDPDKTTYKLGEQIMIVATGTANHSWVGLYKEDETPMAEVPALRWYYVTNTDSGDDNNGLKVDITDSSFIHNNHDSLQEGDYKILLFGDESYGNLVEEIHIKIEGIIDINPDDFTLETDKTQYAYKESIRVKASGAGIGNSAWVGLFPAETNSYSGSYLYYYYVREANGSWVIIQNKNKGTNTEQYVGDGNYKVVLFADGGYNFPIKSQEINVVRVLKYRKVIRDPGCTTFGVEYVTYEDDTSEFRVIPSLGGHDWGNPEKIEGTGKHKYTCKRDSEHTRMESCTSTKDGIIIESATLNETGRMQCTCDLCDNLYSVTIPKMAKAPELATTQLVYSGQKQEPALNKVVDSNGKEIDNSMYTVTWPDSVKVNSYTATVTFKGKYDGSFDLVYKIVPKAVTLKKVTKAKKAFKVTWSKASAQTSGYQIAYSLKSNFSGVKYKKAKGIKKTSLKVKKLKAKKKYYVKVRAYKVVNGKTYYSAWSVVKTVKTK